MFIPNQRVMCVDDSFSASLFGLYKDFPKKGRAYTVRDVVPGIAPNGGKGECAVYLKEIVNPPTSTTSSPDITSNASRLSTRLRSRRRRLPA